MQTLIDEDFVVVGVCVSVLGPQLGAPEKLRLVYDLQLSATQRSRESVQRLRNVLRIAASLGSHLLGPDTQIVRES